ncbi:MAG: hypothetical protein UX04_C0002G0327 [Microgenomates group bacterium GW2011_GWF2_45_18]|nr:MAG: hypothetical protein UW18_C0003G0235 [Microgenomates group bacterium GW2011_GWF1_44_10]KKU02184.1 MAG: hypothetical protein UX04_C0002G0327 [Microgenomates group bacterium GW2011_GWF2_45_18]OGJ40914.1 MAG: hypothetical protein A2378_03190 [Candidatus Pacebacteria bacterium RIFOXYB1_FULL_44_10]HAU99322.1 hypothetical protein [Candidatus Paceibacterota bacterium]
MFDLKSISGIFAIVLTFVSYVPYIYETVKGKTKPHIYSWFLWSFVTFIIFGLQIVGNAGIGAWVTFATGVLCLIVFILGARNGERNITLFDTITFILGLVATGIWIFAKQPAISNILIVTINSLAVLPTVRKSWNQPHSETLSTWVIAGVRNILGIIALEQYSILTWLYPVVSLVINALFSLMLIIRRKQLA